VDAKHASIAHKFAKDINDKMKRSLERQLANNLIQLIFQVQFSFF
jgi:hypothetical protein